MADQSTLAQWVSAVGSITAIAAGFILNYINQTNARRQRREERLDAKRERLRSVKSAAEVIRARNEGALRLVANPELVSGDHLNEKTRFIGAVVGCSEHLKAAVDVINALDIHALDSGNVASAVFALRISIASASGHALTAPDRVRADPGPFDSQKAVLVTFVEAVTKGCDRLLEATNTALATLEKASGL